MLAGFFATAVMTIMMYGATLAGISGMDVAAMLGSVLAKQMPQALTPIWWMGMVWHFINGTLVFALIYAYLIYGLLLGRPWLRGLLWGCVLWLLSQTMVMPMMGMGSFSANSPQRTLVLMASFVAYLVYGAILGAIAGPQAVHGRKRLKGKKFAILIADGFDQIELLEPMHAIELTGGIVDIVSPSPGKVKGWSGADWGKEFAVNVPLERASASDYEGLVLPGGVMNVDKLRGNPSALRFIRSFFETCRPVAAISHGVVTLIDAGFVSGRRLTSSESVGLDLKNAGAQWVDEAVVVDNCLVTSRRAEDLRVFTRKMVEEFAAGRSDEQQRQPAKEEEANKVEVLKSEQDQKQEERSQKAESVKLDETEQKDEAKKEEVLK
jgi:protease I